MTGSGLSAITQMAKKHPVVAGIVFLIIGILTSLDSIKTGTKYAQFVGGERTPGTVIQLRGKTTLPAHYEMTAHWRDRTGKTYSGTLDLFKHEYENFKEGNRVDLLLSRDDPASALVADHLKDNSPVTIAGVSATPLLFVGTAMALFGIGFAIWPRSTSRGKAMSLRTSSQKRTYRR